MLVATATSFAGSPTPVSAAPAPLTIKGEGSWGSYREMLTWQNALGAASQPVDMSYSAHGSLLGRAAVLSGEADFAISGVPYSPAELAPAGGAGAVIDAPIQVSTMGMLLEAPFPDGFVSLKLVCDPDDPTVTDPEACFQRTPYTGPIRVPHQNLAAMMLKYPGPGVTPLGSWNHPKVLQALGVPSLTTPPLAGPAPVMRSDPDELTYYLQQYVKTAAPSVWAGIRAADARVQWEPITERMPRQVGSSRDGVEQQAQQLVLGGADPASGTISNFTAGAFAPVPPSALGGVLQTFPKAKLRFVELQNANGEWVAPTPASINAAVNAGGATPFFALTNKVPGAYPLVWIDHLYAPAHGLSVEKTEALATAIRYIATAGQNAGATVGEGRLSAPLTQVALAAANQLVVSNCTGTDRSTFQSADPGKYAPDVPEMKAIGTMTHCQNGGAPAAPTTTFDGSSTSFDSASSPTSNSSSSATAAPASDTSVVVAKKETHRGAAALAASRLPLPVPGAGSGVDRLATLLLGAGLYLLLRKPVGRLLRRTPS